MLYVKIQTSLQKWGHGSPILLISDPLKHHIFCTKAVTNFSAGQYSTLWLADPPKKASKMMCFAASCCAAIMPLCWGAQYLVIFPAPQALAHLQTLLYAPTRFHTSLLRTLYKVRDALSHTKHCCTRRLNVSQTRLYGPLLIYSLQISTVRARVSHYVWYSIDWYSVQCAELTQTPIL